MKSYLLDEHVAPLYREQLLRRQPDLTVWMIGDEGAPLRGTPDPEILSWCEAHDFLLVTSNRSSMPRHLADHLAADHHIPGILVLRQRATVGSVLEDLLLIAEVSSEDEYRDRIAFVPL